MYTLSNIQKCRRITAGEIASDKEMLGGVQTLGDRAESVLYNARLIVQNKKTLAEKGITAVAIKKKQEIIANCTQTIKSNLAKLGADDKSVAEIIACVENDDMELLRYNLLKMLVKRNPGMYSRKLAIATRDIKQRQH